MTYANAMERLLNKSIEELMIPVPEEEVTEVIGIVYEIMALFVLHKLIFQTCMRSHPVGLDVWSLVQPFVYFHTLCVRTAKALALSWAFTVRLCDKYHNLVSWLKWRVQIFSFIILMNKIKLRNIFTSELSQLMRLWYLSYRRPAKARASLRIRAVSLEPSLFAHMNYGSRQRVWPKIRHLAPLDGCACVFEEWVYGGRKVP